MRYLKIISILFVISLFISCSKDNETIMTYEYGKEYTETFYYSVRNTFTSVCGRLRFYTSENDDNFKNTEPSRSMIDKVSELNKNNNGKDLKYYLVADINFIYYSQSRAVNMCLKSNWKIVIGKMEEYSFEGDIYERLVIVDEEVSPYLMVNRK